MSYNNYTAFIPHQPTAPSTVTRSRRAPSRLPKSFRGVRSMKELTETAAVAAFRARYEAGRSFDIDDDLDFCPAGLLNDDELQTFSSNSSDRSSVTSGSPDGSPLQHQVQPSYAMATPAYPAVPVYYQQQSQTLKYQANSNRIRNAIPIVNPTTGLRVSSPPLASPGRLSNTSTSARRSYM